MSVAQLIQQPSAPQFRLGRHKVADNVTIEIATPFFEQLFSKLLRFDPPSAAIYRSLMLKIGWDYVIVDPNTFRTGTLNLPPVPDEKLAELGYLDAEGKVPPTVCAKFGLPAGA